MERLSLSREGEDEGRGESTYGSLSQSPRYTSSGSRSVPSWQRHSRARWSTDSRTGDNVPGINVVEEDTTNTTGAVSSERSRSLSSRSSRGGPVCPRLPGARVACSQRVPRGRAFFLVLVMLVIERYILYGAVDEVLDLIPELEKGTSVAGLRAFVRVFLFYCVSRIFYPVGGFIADVYVGRCRVIHASLWFYWIAFALLTVAHVLRDLLDSSPELHHHDTGHVSPLYTRVLPIASYIFMILAAGGFEPTLIPFGADQLEAAGSNELSSYFYWFYFAIQIGPLLNIFIGSGLSMCLPPHQADTMELLVTVIVTSCGLVLHNTLERWYFKNALRENCIKLVVKVLWYAARVKRGLPQYRRAFRYGEGKISRINLAKKRYDGKFTGDQVEDVKTFCLLCLILFCLSGYFFSQSGVTVMMTFRVNATIFQATANSSDVAFLQSISPNMFFIVNNTTGLLFVPLVNHLLIPCLPCISMRGRMAVGMVVHMLAVLSAGVLENSLATASHKMEPLHALLLYILPIVLVTLPEVLTFTSALEFVYAQSPESMKGMLTGLLYFILSIFSGGSSVLFYLFLEYRGKPSTNYALYYWILLGVATLGLAVYAMAACVYVNRQRPTSETEEENETHLFYNDITVP